jgi:hypothetical protein
MNEDILNDFNSINIQIKDDPRIIYIEDIFRCLGYVYVTHLKTWIRLAKARQSMTDVTNPYNRANITSGWLFNHMVISGQFNASPTEIEITDAEFDHVCQIFTQAARSSRTLGSIIRDIKDPHDAMWDLCYQFIIPIRLMASSIPADVRMISLRKWINTVFILPFIHKYVQQYVNIIPNSTQLQDYYRQFLNDFNGDCNKMEKFAQIKYEQICSVFISNSACSNSAISFVRLSMMILIFASIDIIKHYCPNFNQCHAINKEFDGAWLNVFDPCHMEHINIINNLQRLVKT